MILGHHRLSSALFLLERRSCWVLMLLFLWSKDLIVVRVDALRWLLLSVVCICELVLMSVLEKNRGVQRWWIWSILRLPVKKELHDKMRFDRWGEEGELHWLIGGWECWWHVAWILELLVGECSRAAEKVHFEFLLRSVLCVGWLWYQMYCTFSQMCQWNCSAVMIADLSNGEKWSWS